MNILFHLVASRKTSGGADISYYELIRGLKERGHRVTLIVDAYPKKIRGIRALKSNRKHYQWADCFVTHPKVRMWDTQGKPVFCIIHSALDPERWDEVLDMTNVTPVFASKSIRNAFGLAYQHEPVSYPIINPKSYKVENTGEYITLVGTSEGKGFKLFCSIAALLPGKSFLSVQGGWGINYVPEHIPPNLLLLPYQDEPRKIYQQTGLLLYIGDSTQGWLHGIGRVMIEAAYNGIPTLASYGPGLLEFGIPTIVADNNPHTWAKAIDEADLKLLSIHTLNAVKSYPTRDTIVDEFNSLITSNG